METQPISLSISPSLSICLFPCIIVDRIEIEIEIERGRKREECSPSLSLYIRENYKSKKERERERGAAHLSIVHGLVKRERRFERARQSGTQPISPSLSIYPPTPFRGWTRRGCLILVPVSFLKRFPYPPPQTRLWVYYFVLRLPPRQPGSVPKSGRRPDSIFN